MPSHRVHRAVNKLLLGKEYEDVNIWMDAPYRYLGSRHRVLRHTPEEVIAKYGFTERALAGLIHIALDRGYSAVKREVLRRWRSR